MDKLLSGIIFSNRNMYFAFVGRIAWNELYFCTWMQFFERGIKMRSIKINEVHETQ